MTNFEKLYHLDVNSKVEKKQGLSYLTWSFAWAEFVKVFPTATYTVVKDENGRCYFGDEDIGYMVYTTVTAEDVTHEMWLPVMDNSNKAMKLKPYEYNTRNGKKAVEGISMFDINKAVMRCLVKNLAMFGLGLYIYAGEDLPEVQEIVYTCEDCGAVFPPFEYQGKKFSSAQAHELSKKKNNGVALCKNCSDKRTSEAIDNG